MCMMCLKYRIILLIVIKNPWVILLTYVLLRGTAPYPAEALCVNAKNGRTKVADMQHVGA